MAWAFEANDDAHDRGKWLDVSLAHLLKSSTAETARRVGAQLAQLQSGDTEVLCPQFELTLKRVTQTPGKTPRGSSRASDTPAPRQPSFGGGGSRASRASARTARGKYDEEDDEGEEDEEQDEQEEDQARHPTVPHAPHAPHRTRRIARVSCVACAAPHRTAPHRTAPHRTAPRRTAPHRRKLTWTATTMATEM